MAAASAELIGFAYGEDVENLGDAPGRSLGFRLLAPAAPQPWGAEVESLARRLQATPYPDHWPSTDLFCSVLLSEGRRLLAVARYGLADHTPNQRRGGLELIGVVGPAGLSVPSALVVYRWLQQRRRQTDDLRALGGSFSLTDILSAMPTSSVGMPHEAEKRRQDPVPVLPIRIWQEGALLFAATAPSDPDHRLELLEQEAGGNWQWLPLIGEDFPVQSLAQRGPLVAWTPHLAGVAVKLDRRADDRPASVWPGPLGGRTRALGGALAVLLILLLAGNLWALISLGAGGFRFGPSAGSVASSSDESQERLAAALLALILEQGNWPDSEQTQKQFIAQYDRVALRHPELRLREPNGKAAIGGVSVLLVQRKRNADQVKKMIEKALTDKEFNDKMSKSIADKVYQQLLTETRE
jgi:hypothetical protein